MTSRCRGLLQSADRALYRAKTNGKNGSKSADTARRAKGTGLLTGLESVPTVSPSRNFASLPLTGRAFALHRREGSRTFGCPAVAIDGNRMATASAGPASDVRGERLGAVRESRGVRIVALARGRS